MLDSIKRRVAIRALGGSRVDHLAAGVAAWPRDNIDDNHHGNCDYSGGQHYDRCHGTVPHILQRRASRCIITPQNSHIFGRIVHDQASKNKAGISSSRGNQCHAAQENATASTANKPAARRIMAIVCAKGFMPWT